MAFTFCFPSRLPCWCVLLWRVPWGGHGTALHETAAANEAWKPSLHLLSALCSKLKRNMGCRAT